VEGFGQVSTRDKVHSLYPALHEVFNHSEDGVFIEPTMEEIKAALDEERKRVPGPDNMARRN
jgi:hypothetical protein